MSETSYDFAVKTVGITVNLWGTGLDIHALLQ